MDTRQHRARDRRVVRHVQPLSAARIAFAISLTLSAVLLVGLFALFLLGTASGAVRSVEGFIVSIGITTADEFRISFTKILPGYMAVSLLFCAIMAGAAAVASVLYNILADLVGGVEVVTRER